MEPSECCLFRIVIASVVGSVITAILLRHHYLVVILGLTPVGGSAAALSAMLLFQCAKPFVSKQPVGLDPKADYFMHRIRSFSR